MWANSELPAVNDTCVSLSEIKNPSYLVACALVSQSNSLCIGLINSLNSSEVTDQGANMARTDSVISEDGVVNPCACVDEFSPWKKKKSINMILWWAQCFLALMCTEFHMHRYFYTIMTMPVWSDQDSSRKFGDNLLVLQSDSSKMERKHWWQCETMYKNVDVKPLHRPGCHNVGHREKKKDVCQNIK